MRHTIYVAAITNDPLTYIGFVFVFYLRHLFT